MTRRELILAIVSDLVGDFVYYDRKESGLTMADLNDALDAGEITANEIVAKFASEIARWDVSRASQRREAGA